MDESAQFGAQNCEGLAAIATSRQAGFDDIDRFIDNHHPVIDPRQTPPTCVFTRTLSAVPKSTRARCAYSENPYSLEMEKKVEQRWTVEEGCGQDDMIWMEG